MTNDYNPIRSVNGKAIKCPSAYQWKLEDISSADAGRTEDTRMDKMRIGQIVGIELAWQNVSIEDAADILKAFDDEYLQVCYLDAKQGQFVTSEFYVGNRSVPMYNSRIGVWSNLAFNLIERSGV